MRLQQLLLALRWLMIGAASSAACVYGLSPREQLAYSTVRIVCTLTDGSIASGSGFFFRCSENPENQSFVPVIITNRHVVEGAIRGEFLLHLAGQDGAPLPGKNTTITLFDFARYWTPHPDGTTDLCAMPLAPLAKKAAEQNTPIYYTPITRELVADDSALEALDAYERILMIGYPIGLWDSRNNMPIFRAGVTATHPAADYEGRSEFMIDAACVPGSSGSPVLLCDVGNYVAKSGMTMIDSRIKLLGVLYAGPMQTVQGEIRIVTIPTRQREVAITDIPINLGYVIKAKKLLDFDRVFPNPTPKPAQSLFLR
jgi:hypothetical protein